MHKLFNFISVSDGHTVLDTRPTTLLNAWDVFTQLRVFTLLFFSRFWLGSLLGLCNMLSQFHFLITFTRDKAQQSKNTLIVFTNFQLAMPDAVVELVRPAKLNLLDTHFSTCTVLIKRFRFTRPSVLSVHAFVLTNPASLK